MDSQLIIPKESKADLASTWKIYKSHWKTFIALAAFLVLASIIYSIIDFILSLIGLVPISLTEYTDYEYIGVGAFFVSAIIRTPIYLVYSVVTALLTVLFMVLGRRFRLKLT